MPSSTSFTSGDDSDISSHSHDFITLRADSDAPSYSRNPSMTANDIGDASLIWLGDKALDAIMASAVVQTLRGNQDVHRLNSFLYSTKAILFENDIPLVLSSLGGPSDQQAGTCTSSTPSDRALRATGSAFREDNAEGLEMLLNAIKQIIRASHDVGQGQEASRTLQAQFPRAEHVPHVPVRETTGPQMQAYTMAFYQRAQAEKEEIRFSCHQVDYGTLPSFHAVYLYRGKEYSANGSSSKQAKHMASKNACDDLNIYIHA